MFVRKHLPDHAVTQPLFPLVACRDAAVTTATIILPARYWSPALLEFWGKPT